MPEFSYEHPPGQTRHGTYSLDGHPKMIEVITDFGRRIGRIDHTPPEVLARMIARELARDAGRKGRKH